MNRTYEFQDLSGDWIGVVINNQDPTFAGRAKVRVFGIMDGIKDEHVPWAIPLTAKFYAGNGGGNISIPKLGQIVRIKFNGDDIYAPEIIAIQNIDSDLIEKIKEDYQGTHVIIYDPEVNLSIIHQVQSGLMIFYKDSFFQISPDSMITLQTENADSVIQLEGDVTRVVTKNEVIVAAAAKATVTADEVVVSGANTTKVGPGPTYEPAVLGSGLWAILTTMASAIDAKAPATPGLTVGLVESLKLAATSTNVQISKF